MNFTSPSTAIATPRSYQDTRLPPPEYPLVISLVRLYRPRHSLNQARLAVEREPGTGEATNPPILRTEEEREVMSTLVIILLVLLILGGGGGFYWGGPYVGGGLGLVLLILLILALLGRI